MKLLTHTRLVAGVWLWCVASAHLCACADESEPKTERPRENDHGGEPAVDGGGPIEQPDGDAGEAGSPPPTGAPPATAVALQGRFMDVCSGTYAGDASAPAYDPRGDASHGMLVLNVEGKADAFNAAIDAAQRPALPEQVELVVCLAAPELKTVDVCEYPDWPDVPRRRYSQNVRVVLTSTGETWGTFLGGGNPNNCPSAPREGPNEVLGAKVSLETFTTRIVNRFVHGSRCPASYPVRACFSCYASEEAAKLDGCTSERAFDSGGGLRFARLGETVTLSWTGMLFQPLYRLGYRFDWSSSKDADLLDTTEGPEARVTLTEPGRYTFAVQALLPGVSGDVVTNTMKLEVETSENGTQPDT